MRLFNTILPCVIGLVLAGLPGLALAEPASETVPQVRHPFGLAATPADLASRPMRPGEKLVQVDHAALGSTTAGDLIDMNGLLAGAMATIERVEEHRSGSYSLFGRVNADPDSLVVICVHEDAVVGVFQQPLSGINYRMRVAPDGLQTIYPVTPGAERCGTGDGPVQNGAPAVELQPEIVDDPGDAGDGETQPRGGCSAPARRFDLLMYYTVAAANVNGGSSAAVALCQLGVSLANQAYADSGVSARLFLLDARQTSYTESGTLETDRDRLKDPNDGILDSVHAARDALGADMVCLMVTESDPVSGGIAYCTPNESQGFCVVEEDNIDDGVQVLAHEVGHLQGCAHNHGDAGSGCNEFCYSFGHRFTGLSGQGWRTIMSYDDGGSNFPNVVPRFSNPGQNWDGFSLGVDTSPCGVFPSNDDADNARSIDNNAASVEAFRAPAIEVWVDNSYSGTELGTWWNPWSTLNSGITAIYGDSNEPLLTPTLKVKANTYTATPRITKVMRIEACGGTVRIGG